VREETLKKLNGEEAVYEDDDESDQEVGARKARKKGETPFEEQ
jgi:hypothetical protein